MVNTGSEWNAGILQDGDCKFIYLFHHLCLIQNEFALKRHNEFSGFNVWRTSESEFDVHGTVHRFNVYKHNQQDATLHKGIYYCQCSTCFRRFLRPSSGAQNCIHNIECLSSFFCFLPHERGKKQKNLDKYPMLCIQFWAPDDGRMNRLKQVEHL
jgi:hypothetical protein